jgi:hypothetical protein
LRSSRLLKKAIRHAERSEASAVSSGKQTKQILRFAQDDAARGVFQQPASAALGIKNVTGVHFHYALLEPCILNTLTGPATEFRHVPPGRYRIFIFDSQLLSKVSAYAPRFPDFLKNQAPAVEVLNKGEAKATATYVDGKTVRQAIQRAGPIR